MDIERAQVLPLGKRRPIPGVEYRVIADFRDDAGLPHPVGERWVYLGFDEPRLYAGYMLYVREEGGVERSFCLRWGDERRTPGTSTNISVARADRLRQRRGRPAIGLDRPRASRSGAGAWIGEIPSVSLPEYRLLALSSSSRQARARRQSGSYAINNCHELCPPDMRLSLVTRQVTDTAARMN